MTRRTRIGLLAALLLALPGALTAQDEWDVNAPLGPADTLAFDATEGTWMNVDVSPDGSTIVFDMLGDIYSMPIEGGPAELILGGQAFEMQPRFSPDGEHIAFISDRDGALNIWLADAGGGNLRQISRESQREVNSPAWSPDGEYVFARKHFVDTRSLGAGAVWMYHISGSGGVEVVERNGWQKDLGEPALSPDGRYLYYSRNVWPGQNFEYNKNPYQTIYAIRRVDLETGDESTVTSRPGGSITPRISPDGTKMAFIRRVRLNTVLFLRDLATGEEWPVWDGLERDMQEAWAIHGVYTQYDWLPDGSAIAIWAQGKIWEVDVSTGEAQIIPFTAPVHQAVHRAVRPEQDPSPDRFRVRMLRDVVTSPDGRFVAYSAMGRLYIRELPQGTPRRLTRDDAIEVSPSFSADGRQIVYATWTDDEMGRIRVVGTDGIGGRDVVTEMGHYTEPAFSPDGEHIVYRKVGGSSTRGNTHTLNTGIYVVPTDGGEPRLVRQGGSNPGFDASGERIWFNGGGGGVRLSSVALDGTDPIDHALVPDGTELVPSPDGNWVAFTVGYRAYLAALPRAGGTVTLGPNAATPVGRISENAGAYLHWSGDGRAVHWTLGPEYFSRDLTETFPYVAGGAREPDPPEAAGLNIGFTQPSDRPTGQVAFTGARVVTMADGAEDGGVLENATVLVDGNRILAVGTDVDVPDSAHVVDATGKTIMPGLIDVHAHVGFGPGDGIVSEQHWGFMANLTFGVTTSHDPSNTTSTVFTNAEMIRAGLKVGPRLFSTGSILYGAETGSKAVVNSYEDAEKHLARMKAVGAFSVKSYNQRKRDARQWIIQAARQLDMQVYPEGGSLVYNNMSMVLDGHTTVEHSLPVANVYEDVVNLFATGSTGYTPTLVVAYGGLSGEYYWYERTNVWENERLLNFTPRDGVDPRGRRRQMAAGDEDFNHVDIAAGAKAIQDAGGLIALGAHGQVQGLGAHWELWSLHQGGMTEVEALRAATLDGAKIMGMEAHIGSLEAGKLADLVVLNSNPLEDLRNSEDIQMVMVNGRLYDAMTMNQIGNHPRDRGAFWFERLPAEAPMPRGGEDPGGMR